MHGLWRGRAGSFPWGLVFFSTATGDAWLLDADDSLALCLAVEGKRQPVKIDETPEQFAIEWEGTFEIDGEGDDLRRQYGPVADDLRISNPGDRQRPWVGLDPEAPGGRIEGAP